MSKVIFDLKRRAFSLLYVEALAGLRMAFQLVHTRRIFLHADTLIQNMVAWLHQCQEANWEHVNLLLLHATDDGVGLDGQSTQNFALPDLHHGSSLASLSSLAALSSISAIQFTIEQRASEPGRLSCLGPGRREVHERALCLWFWTRVQLFGACASC